MTLRSRGSLLAGIQITSQEQRLPLQAENDHQKAKIEL